MSKAIALALLSGICFMADGAATAGKTVRIKPDTKELLLKIKEAGDKGFLIEDRTAAPVKELIKNGYVLFNETSAKEVNGKQQVLSALSPEGIAKAESYKVTKEGSERGPLPSPDDFEIETDVPMPDFSTRRIAPRQIYPFDKLTPGASFFIPQPEAFKGENFAQAKQSTISAQNKRAKEAWEAKPEDERGVLPTWKITNDEKAGVKGARVFRVT